MCSLLTRADEVKDADEVWIVLHASVALAFRIVKNNDGYPGKAEDWFCMKLLQGV